MTTHPPLLPDCRETGGIKFSEDACLDSGAIHFDRYYRAEGATRKDFDVEVSSVFEAEKRLAENWRRYARLYEENHGQK